MARKQKDVVTARALMELKMPGDVQVAPDGKRIAFTVAETDWSDNAVVVHLWITGAQDDAESRQLTRGRDSAQSPRWSPDGRWLAFLSARAGDGDPDEEDGSAEEPKQQIYLLPMDGWGGEAERLTDAPEGVGYYEWEPDSTGVYYTAREPRAKPLDSAREDRLDRSDDGVVEREERFRQQIWRIGREDKKPRLVYTGDFGLTEIALSPDGLSLVFTTNYTGEVNDYHIADLWIIDPKTGKTRRLTEGLGGKYHPVWLPDSSHVLFVRPLNPELSFSQANVYSVRIADLAVDCVTADFPYDITGWPSVRCDRAGRIYVLAACGTSTAIFRRSAGAFEAVVHEQEHIHDFHVGPEGEVAFVASGAEDVPELFYLAPGRKKAVALTDLNEEWYEAHEIARSDLVTWQSTDGASIEGILTYPTGTNETTALPLIVYLHGGPHARIVQALTPYTQAQVYAGAGYAVLSPNYRGSEGYGDAFSTSIRGDLGGIDYADVMAGVDSLIESGTADAARLGVTGSSYGGYLANWIVTHTNRFQAAITRFGIFSLASDFSNSQSPRWEVEYLNGHYWENPAQYAERSPAPYVADVQTPVLILHGENDPNTFISNSQEFYTALRLLGKTVEYVHYPREEHGISEPVHRLDEFRRSLSWFDRYVRFPGLLRRYRIGERQLRDGWELTVVEVSLAQFAGLPEKHSRYIQVVFVLRDTSDQHRSLALGPGNVLLRSETSKSVSRAAGLPLRILGESVLAQGSGWRFRFEGKVGDSAGLAAPISVAFKVSNRPADYQLIVNEFSPVTFHVPANLPDKPGGAQKA